jgi:hypothetical protein
MAAAAMRPLQTEFAFTLPCGFPDERGNLHRDGVMRLATALDEIQPLTDPRVQANPAYVSILLLSRVVTQLGNLSPVSPGVVERLFAADFAYLQDLYLRVNDTGDGTGTGLIETECPSCSRRFMLDLTAGAVDG